MTNADAVSVDFAGVRQRCYFGRWSYFCPLKGDGTLKVRPGGRVKMTLGIRFLGHPIDSMYRIHLLAGEPAMRVKLPA